MSALFDELVHCIKLKNELRVKEISEQYPLLKTFRDADGWDALMYAADRGSLALVKLLYAKESFNHNKENALLLVCKKRPHSVAEEKERAEIVTYLVERGFRVNYLSDQEENALLLAVQNQIDGHIVTALLGAGADPNLCKTSAASNKNSVLQLAIDKIMKQKPDIKPNMEQIQLLIQRGADVRYANNLGRTALFTALQNKNPHGQTIVNLLLTHAPILVFDRDATGWDPMMHAAFQGSLAMVELLHNKGAEPRGSFNHNNEHALFLACKKKPNSVEDEKERAEIVRYLAVCGLNVNHMVELQMPDPDAAPAAAGGARAGAGAAVAVPPATLPHRLTVLFAAITSQIEGHIVTALLECHADPNLDKTVKRESSLLYYTIYNLMTQNANEPVIRQRLDQIRLLLQQGADPNHANKDGYSPLFAALFNNNPHGPAIVALLLKFRVNVDHRVITPRLGQPRQISAIEFALANNAHAKSINLLLNVVDNKAIVESGEVKKVAENAGAGNTAAAADSGTAVTRVADLLSNEKPTHAETVLVSYANGFNNNGNNKFNCDLLETSLNLGVSPISLGRMLNFSNLHTHYMRDISWYGMQPVRERARATQAGSLEQPQSLLRDEFLRISALDYCLKSNQLFIDKSNVEAFRTHYSRYDFSQFQANDKEQFSAHSMLVWATENNQACYQYFGSPYARVTGFSPAIIKLTLSYTEPPHTRPRAACLAPLCDQLVQRKYNIYIQSGIDATNRVEAERQAAERRAIEEKEAAERKARLDSARAIVQKRAAVTSAAYRRDMNRENVDMAVPVSAVSAVPVVAAAAPVLIPAPMPAPTPVPIDLRARAHDVVEAYGAHYQARDFAAGPAAHAGAGAGAGSAAVAARVGVAASAAAGADPRVRPAGGAAPANQNLLALMKAQQEALDKARAMLKVSSINGNYSRPGGAGPGA